MALTKIRGNTQIKTGSITNVEIASNAGIELSKLAEGAELIKRDGSVAFTGNVDAGSHKVVNVSAPTAAMDAANKQYVDDGLETLRAQVQDDLDPRLDAIEGRMTTAESDIDALQSDLAAEVARAAANDDQRHKCDEHHSSNHAANDERKLTG
jgi:Skp family chaperone for outer membrane proteins